MAAYLHASTNHHRWTALGTCRWHELRFFANIAVTLSLVAQDISIGTGPMTLADPPADPGTEALLLGAARGDSEALGNLLEKHRERLRRMVAFRLDSHMAAHVDASDIVQEALTDAIRKLPDYSNKRPLPFYPWLHRLASERLVQARRRYRREPETDAWPDGSANLLVDRLVDSEATPGDALVRAEERQRVRAALDRLAAPDREILIMRYLEDLKFSEIAAILGIEEAAAKMRHFRALKRIHVIMQKGDRGPDS